MESCAVYTLTEIVERYCAFQFNNRQKGFKNYLVMAEQVWNDLFNNTLWCFKSVWLTPQQGSPYPFINLPENYSRLLSLRSECVGKDGVSFLQPVLANDTTTAIAKPSVKACGCKKNCGCGSLCDGVANMQYETKRVTITIGQAYSPILVTMAAATPISNNDGASLQDYTFSVPDPVAFNYSLRQAWTSGMVINYITVDGQQVALNVSLPTQDVSSLQSVLDSLVDTIGTWTASINTSTQVQLDSNANTHVVSEFDTSTGHQSYGAGSGSYHYQFFSALWETTPSGDVPHDINLWVGYSNSSMATLQNALNGLGIGTFTVSWQLGNLVVQSNDNPYQFSRLACNHEDNTAYNVSPSVSNVRTQIGTYTQIITFAGSLTPGGIYTITYSCNQVSGSRSSSGNMTLEDLMDAVAVDINATSYNTPVPVQATRNGTTLTVLYPNGYPVTFGVGNPPSRPAGGGDYEERTWIEVQPNGDVWRWREVPTPFYDSTGQFDGNQFDPTQFDTNIGESITNVQIVKLQERVGKVELKDCGCVAETPENQTVLGSCFCTGCASTQKGDRTTYKFSDCGTKLYLIGEVKSTYLLQYQLAGASAEADVPRYAAKAVWDGITFFSRAYNNSVSPSVVKALETTYRASKNTIIEHLNPIDLDVVNQLRDEPIKL